MPDALDWTRGIAKGIGEASGNQTAVADIDAQQARQRQAQQQALQQKLAPLTQALQASRTRLALYANPDDPTQPVKGKEDEYNAAHDQVAGIIGQMRRTISPEPSETPGGLGYLSARALDKLRITHDLANHVREDQNEKVADYGHQTQRDVSAAVQATPVNPVYQKQQQVIAAGGTPEQANQAAGIGPKPGAQSFRVQDITLPDGRKISAQQDTKSGKWYDLTGQEIPADQLRGAAVSGTGTSDTRARSDFEDFKKSNPNYAGSFEQWKAEQAGSGRIANNRDDRYIAIQQKMASGQPLSEEDKTYTAAYDTWVKKTKVNPGIARAAAFGADRFVPVVDPQDPNNVTLMRAGDAARAHVGTPAGIGFQTDKAITRYMTSGAGATNINYFNTASDHLKLLQEAGTALNNGNVQLFNSWAQRYAQATGDPAPSNFEAVKAAVSGELSKTFKGTGATDQEISQINTTINRAQSPQQIQGAIDYYTRLMDSKLDALKGQYQAGQQGRPNFPGSIPEGPKTRGLRGSIGSKPPAGATMRVPGSDGKLHWSDGTRDLGLVQ